ncbi:hypothetical protein ACQP1V_03690 [Microtetraspora malaysiensis]|uniref:hypothetical protein n=1 Tax=Microtetraspora malaysiensis TaxID=161358 RepID=UPI003D9205F4
MRSVRFAEASLTFQPVRERFRGFLRAEARIDTDYRSVPLPPPVGGFQASVQAVWLP